MVPGPLACSDSGAASTPVFQCRFGRSSDLSHRKSATTAGAPNEHPPRVLQQPPTGPSHAAMLLISNPQTPPLRPRQPLSDGATGPQTAMKPGAAPQTLSASCAWSCLYWRPCGLEQWAVGWRDRAWRTSAWSWCSEWSGCFLLWLSALAILRAERRGAAGAVAETWSGGGHGPPARADRRRRAALIQ
jgi:hypothetical protein